ncbi:MAG: hypothetical protein COU33_01750 [Candidatus Magasanikbacteria bacterium CG10_big_fil_rev_8_21_14_0_10_43_6]|uniref:Uncharacterized protein n=1 Tax=Candidatus Magasanikbacteria bacterium CG10_big_fil_rev_8_21_14_0_10_43_6 TaxID=1974650 RepID=A0A2M6W1J4_9BACT|nr:MAG: hypothetical protein COU33_01750 [Candidatus Magasanikbacteria bacterium CG10_big_fil_rev_8_21_14_0_10_43_6]
MSNTHKISLAFIAFVLAGAGFWIIQDKKSETSTVDETVLTQNTSNIEEDTTALENLTIEQRIEAVLTHQGVSKEEFSRLDACTQKQLHNTVDNLFKVELYNDGKHEIIVYTTPNKEKLTLDQFMKYSIGCEELGSMTPFALAGSGTYQMWFSQLGCGSEIGEAFENETSASKKCDEINREVMNIRGRSF